eukprot:CAMPEP_0177760292 /NCGR_PEP_ID=MMETSP0491_2-20121128/5191_1 /TAXON_ID=63592 /ORGANISM="Tetraselmis chuii, Strain PLY429" /LENGTH=243 /DNA_ID=CAMNT_0019276185 /DNA_START=86 /DNA_END=814 /DNA_ORIENTATION=+
MATFGFASPSSAIATPAHRCQAVSRQPQPAFSHRARCPSPARRSPEFQLFLPHRRQLTVAAGLLPSFPAFPLGGAKKKKAAEALKAQLLAASEGTRYGAKCSNSRRQKVEDLVVELIQCGGDRAPTASSLNGEWSLVFTTEKSVHALANGVLLGLPVTGIRQTVDLREPRVTNSVSLALGCRLQASGPAVIAGPQRVEYAFDSAQLRLPGGLQLAFRPRGGGWTDAVFCDGAMRVMRNSQGDT